uniref:DNA polymerase n=1 Tax=uncultured Duncaniella sp. TaxID=2768039 RepID=UPI00260ECDF3
NLINKWYKSKPLVKQYIDTQRSKPLRNEPCTTILGRMRHFVITDAELNHIQNEYINTPIQSAASDMTMLSLLTMDEYIRQNLQDKAKICTTVHDSIILEVVDDPEIYVPLAEKCKQIMAEVPKQYIPNCVVPFKADVEVGRKWGAMYEVEEFINEGH